MADVADIRNKTCNVDSDSNLRSCVDETLKSKLASTSDRSKIVKSVACSTCDPSPRLLSSENFIDDDRSNPTNRDLVDPVDGNIMSQDRVPGVAVVKNKDIITDLPKESLSNPSPEKVKESTRSRSSVKPTDIPSEADSQNCQKQISDSDHIKETSNFQELDLDPLKSDPLRVHTFGHHQTRKEEASKLSASSLSSEDEDGEDVGLSRCRSVKEMKLVSSSLSNLSADQDTVDLDLDLYGFLECLSEKSDLSSDDSSEYWDDWEPCFVSDNLQGNSIPEMDDNLSELELAELDLPFPHRAQHIMECEICVTMAFVRRRVCCDYQICHQCLATYITMKVKEGKCQMECPNDRCNVLVFKDEIHYRLSPSMREKFTKYLIDANADPYVKTCPSCSLPHNIDPALLNVSKKKLKHGVKVTCNHCKLEWCFPCHAPFHTSLTCKKYKKEDEMVRRWAKERKDGQTNAQRCPKCKVYIQKKNGCDHMQCSRCNTDFCYRCGDRYISIKLLGNHWSRFSLFGCKYRLLPQKPALRRLIRGTSFGARLIAAVALAGLGVAAGAVLLGVSVFILPGYGIVHLRRNMWARKKRKKFLKQKMLMLAAAQREKELLNCRGELLFLDSQGYMSTIPEESETETSNPTSDPQQVQVLVHRSVSFNKDDTEDRSKDCDILVNKYVNDGSGVFVSRAVDESNSAAEGPKEDEVIMVTDVQEIVNESGYSTVVCNIVSKVDQASSESEGKNENKEESSEVVEAELNLHNDVIDTNVDIVRDGTLTQVSKNKFISSADIHPQKESGKESINLNEGNTQKIMKKECLATHATEVDDVFPCYGANKLQCETDENLKEKDDRLKEKEERLTEKDDRLKEKEEKLKEKDDRLKEKEERLKEREVQVSKSRSIPEKAPVSEAVSAKTANNGCFGSIFSSSKRAGSPIPENQEASKGDTKPSKAKDLFSSKSATWEKCRRTNSEPMQKTAVDVTADIKQLPYYVQKSPSSLSSIISFSYGVEDEGKAKVNESFIPVIKTDSPAEPEEIHRVAENGYLSQFKFVTYL